MRIEVARDRITLQVTATWEEILVAATAAGRGAAPLDERVRRHGEYVLSRLIVESDGQPLHGTVTATPAPDSPPPFTYTLSYQKSGPLARPRERAGEGRPCERRRSTSTTSRSTTTSCASSASRSAAPGK